MRKYEVMFIVRQMEEDAINQVIDRFRKLIADNGGTIDEEDIWGRRQLAYEVKKQTEGFYVLFYVTAEPACLREVDRVMKIAENVLKHMIVRSEGPVKKAVSPEAADAEMLEE